MSLRSWVLEQLAMYAAYHRDRRNRATHHLGVPLIVFALLLALNQVELGQIGTAQVTVPAGAGAGTDLAELFITATVVQGQGDAVSVTPTTDAKCGRCWRHLPDVAEDGALCGRCESVVTELDGAA